MSWRTRFRARQYVKGSLWLAIVADTTAVAVSGEYWRNGTSPLPSSQNCCAVPDAGDG